MTKQKVNFCLLGKPVEEGGDGNEDFLDFGLFFVDLDIKKLYFYI